MSTLVKTTAYSIEPTNFKELKEYAELIANSGMVPASFKGKSGDVLVAIQMGSELGLKPMQSLQNIAVINGRPSVWGDAALAIAQAHPAYEWIDEQCDGVTASCTVKRKGEEPYTVTFSQEQAKKAGLWGKAGPWTQYPTRMLQVRARGFCLRDKFPDALKGLITAEEARDYQSEEKLKFVNQSKGAEGLKAVLSIQEPESKPAETPENVNLETGEVIDTWAIQDAMNKAQDLEELKAIAADIKELPIDEEQRKFLGGIYKMRKGELSGNE
jgi:hypothetical protein